MQASPHKKETNTLGVHMGRSPHFPALTRQGVVQRSTGQKGISVAAAMSQSDRERGSIKLQRARRGPERGPKRQPESPQRGNHWLGKASCTQAPLNSKKKFLVCTQNAPQTLSTFGTKKTLHEVTSGTNCGVLGSPQG